MARDFFQYLVKVRGVVVAAEFTGGFNVCLGVQL
jgi:hypothetical protein